LQSSAERLEVPFPGGYRRGRRASSSDECSKAPTISLGKGFNPGCVEIIDRHFVREKNSCRHKDSGFHSTDAPHSPSSFSYPVSCISNITGIKLQVIRSKLGSNYRNPDIHSHGSCHISLHDKKDLGRQVEG